MNGFGLLFARLGDWGSRVVLFLGLFVLLLVPERVEAFAACVWTSSMQDLDAHPTDAPVELKLSYGVGMLCVPNWTEVSAELTDSAGTLVAGQVQVSPTGEKAFWVPAAPLPAEQSFSLHIVTNSAVEVAVEVDQIIQLRTGPSPLELPSSLSLGEPVLREQRRATSACCWICPDTLTECYYCWDESYFDYPSLVVPMTVEVSAASAPFFFVELVVEQGGEVLGQEAYSCDFSEASVELAEGFTGTVCVQGVLRRITDGSELLRSEERCVEASTLVRLEPATPPLVDFSSCEDAENYADHPLNKDRVEGSELEEGAELVESGSSSSGSCSVASRQAPPWWWGAVLLVGLCWPWRRRAQR